MSTTTVLTEDLWAALDALDAVPEAQQTEWYKRLEEAADAKPSTNAGSNVGSETATSISGLTFLKALRR